MDYVSFCKILTGEFSELPINRKERFYTGTVLPALLFHNGLNNFYTFLQAIKGFPPEINEAETKDNFLFYTDYNLKESAGDRNVGRKIHAETNDTPDVIIEIFEPRRIFIIIEAKMFEKINQSKLNRQIRRQRKYVAEPIKKTFQLENNQIFHIALVPKASMIKDNKHYQVINWEFFINKKALDVRSNYFYNYLKFALDNYDDLVAKSGPPRTVEDYMRGTEVYKKANAGDSFWVGRNGGREKIIEDKKSNKLNTQNYPINYTSSYPPTRNWISAKEFKQIVDTDC